MPDDQAVIDTLRDVSSATIHHDPAQEGPCNAWMRGPRPLRAEQPRLIGRRLHHALHSRRAKIPPRPKS